MNFELVKSSHIRAIGRSKKAENNLITSCQSNACCHNYKVTNKFSVGKYSTVNEAQKIV